MALVHSADTLEFGITTTPINGPPRVLFHVPSGRAVNVEDARVARDTDCAAVLTGEQLGYFRESYFSKELADPPTNVLDFVELLKCLELVTDVGGRSECFLRAKVNTCGGRNNAKDKTDTVHMNPLPLAFLHGIKKRLDANHYTDDELTKEELGKFKIYFDKINLPGTETTSLVNKEIVQGLEADLACDITTAIRIIPTTKVSDAAPDSGDATTLPGAAKGTWEFENGFNSYTDFNDIKSGHKTNAQRPRVIERQKRKRAEGDINDTNARNARIASFFKEFTWYEGGVSFVLSGDVDAKSVQTAQFGNKTLVAVPFAA